MKTCIDVAAAGQTAEARALLDRLDDSQVISLGVLSGADLCMLGAVGHPVWWEALRRAWQGLDQKERELARRVWCSTLLAVGRLPGNHEAGVALVHDVAGGEVDVWGSGGQDG